jgi:hypothetical protein
LGILFAKLQQGVVENQQVLLIARLRADAEELYGTRLCAIAPASDKPGGFERDDGASVRKVCVSVGQVELLKAHTTNCDAFFIITVL